MLSLFSTSISFCGFLLQFLRTLTKIGIKIQDFDNKQRKNYTHEKANRICRNRGSDDAMACITVFIGLFLRYRNRVNDDIMSGEGIESSDI